MADQDIAILLVLLMGCGFAVVGATESRVSMVFGGDISFNGIVEYMVDKDHCTYEESLDKLKPIFKGIDFVVANLESVVYKEAENDASKIYGPKIVPPANSSSVHSIQDLSALKAIKDAGINCVSVANSHVGHFTVAQDQLKNHKIKYFGLSKNNNRVKQKPLILKKNGVKIGLLGYCMTKGCKKTKDNSIGAALLQVKTAVKQAKKLRKSGVHAVIMFLNWGNKYQSVISPNAILTIRKIISKVKIDLIVGTHPGVTHAHWIVNQTLVASSLGNLLAPPYMSAAMNFAPKYKHATNKSWLPMYEKLWHKQMKIMDDPSRYGKLLKVEIDQDGLIMGRSAYLKTQITATPKHCMVVDKVDWTDVWREACQLNDEECAGTRQCNYITCDDLDPLPVTLTHADPSHSASEENLKEASGPGSIPIQRLQITEREEEDENRPHFLAPLVPPCTGMAPHPVPISSYDSSVNSLVKCTNESSTQQKLEKEVNPIISDITDPAEVSAASSNDFLDTNPELPRRKKSGKSIRKLIITSWPTHQDLVVSNVRQGMKSEDAVHTDSSTAKKKEKSSDAFRCRTNLASHPGPCKPKFPPPPFFSPPCLKSIGCQNTFRRPCGTKSHSPCGPYQYLFKSQNFRSNLHGAKDSKKKSHRAIKWRNKKLKKAGAIF